MKSRKFTFTNSTAIPNAAKGLLLTRPAQGAVAAGSAVRRFELQHNQSPRFARRRQERRKGQALLLAVLIMLLAALLSAGFLAVVSGNLNQSARVADKTRAIEASRAGIAYANAQLSGSSQGDLWRPIDVSPAPDTNDAAYNFYYSQLDKVQGWAAKPQPQPGDTYPNAVYNVPNYEAAKAVYRSITYGKFPDPNQVAGDAPKFLVKVREVPSNITDPDYEADHVGEIKITSIGLSEDDPNVFHRAVAYKEGRKKSPWSSALRSISNWKVGTTEETTGVPNGLVTAPVTANPSAAVPVDINNEGRPQFDAGNVPFDVVIIKKDPVTPANSTVRGAVVTNVATSGTTTTLTLAKLDNDIVAGETVEKAAAIGTGSTIDLLNTGDATPPTIEAAFPDYAQPNGILANGSIWLQNQAQLSNLGNDGTRLFTSGSLAIDDSDPTTAKKLVLPSQIVGTPITGNVDSNKLVPSNVGYPGNNIVLTAAAMSNGVETTDFIEDGWNKINAVKALGLEYIPDQTRTVKPFTPVQIDSAQNLTRYRALTRNSANGVYIDNRDDVEKVGTAPMTQAQLVEMLMSPTSATPADFTRTGTAIAPGTVGNSLEQKHLRGWVGPDEFLARGALIEISPEIGPDGNAPSLRVTLDARSDSTTANPNNDSGPDNNKVFRKDDGTLDTGVYTKVLPWPANGTLFAEGNLRIRGDVGGAAAPRSLTVVSLGNIYVEGSLSVDNRFVGTNPDPDRKKLMLLAKKNVIVNPTRAVLARTDVATVATNAAPITVTGTTGTAANLTLPVANGVAFNQGDYVLVDGQRAEGNPPVPVTKPVRGLVITATANQLTIRTADTGTVNANAIVRSPLEKRDVGTNASARAFFSLVDTENAINRRIVAPIFTKVNSGDNNRVKLVFDHVGDLKKTGTVTDGLNIKAEDSTAPPAARPSDFKAELTNKQPLTSPTENLDSAVRGVSQANKSLRIYNNFLNLPDLTNKKEFDYNPNPGPPITTKFLPQFVAEINAFLEPPTAGPPPQGYKYTATSLPLTTDYSLLPSYSLAGVGLRYEAGTAYDPSAPNRRQNINTADGFTIPLATSVEYDLNGGLSNLLPTVGSSPVTKYIGFAPDINDADDAFTVDSSFYRTKDDVNKSSLDSRVFDSPIDPSGLAPFPKSIVLRRSTSLSDNPISALLPEYRVRSMKMENIYLTDRTIKPVSPEIQVNAFVYAQEGSWLVIPGDYIHSDLPVRGEMDSTSKALTGSYIDYNGNGASSTGGLPDPGEYILQGATKIADLNRNGRIDNGEKEAALRFVRYNYAPIKFFGAIIENQTAVVADVKDAAGTNTLVKGAVQDWMDKWATYRDDVDTNGNPIPNTDVGKSKLFSFINYAYDPSLAVGSPGANQLRVPVTDDLLYQQ